jgi:hypothetical protein
MIRFPFIDCRKVAHQFWALGLLCAMVSCGITSHKNFTAYKQKPIDETSAKFKIDGIYFVKPYKFYKHSPPIYFYLFPDGSLIQVHGAGTSHVVESEFWDDPENYLKNLRLKFGTSGHYFVRDSVITIQFFQKNPQTFISYNSLELVGKIRNDTTISIERGNCKWCANSWLGYNRDGTINFDNMEYGFHKTGVFPDTSIMWFKDKKWYKDEVWNTQPTLKQSK